MAKKKQIEEASIVEEEKEKNEPKQKESVIKEKQPKKALFIQRFAAFILDVFIVSMVASMLAYPFLDLDSIEKLNQSSTQIVEDYVSQKIDANEYMNESISVSYEMARKQGILSLIVIFLNVLYFVVFQIKNNGQTIGKKLLKIRVSSKDGQELTMNQMIFRSLIINSILIDMVSFCVLLFADDKSFFYGAGFLGMIQFLIMAVSGFMIMFSDRRQGIHDLITHTDVVKCDLVEEMKTCES